MRLSSGFSCSKGFLLVLAALIYLDGQGLVLWSILACVIHELGHWVMIMLMGGKVRALRLTVVGAEMKLDTQHSLSYGREVAAALAGPAANLLTAWISVLGGWHLFAGLNLCFGVLNLIPVFPLDGGRALSFALAVCDLQVADIIIRALSVVFSGVLLGLGWAAWRECGNITLLCTAIWLTSKVLKS